MHLVMDRRHTQICSKCKSNCTIFNHFTCKYGLNCLTGVSCTRRHMRTRLYLWKCQKALGEKKSKKDEQTLAELNSGHRHSQAKYQSAQTSWRMEDTNAAVKIQAFNGIRTYDLCITGAMLYQPNYQSHMRAAVFGFSPLCSVDIILGSSI